MIERATESERPGGPTKEIPAGGRQPEPSPGRPVPVAVPPVRLRPQPMITAARRRAARRAR